MICTSQAEVAGGLVMEADSTILEGCTNTAEIISPYLAGGIAGLLFNGSAVLRGDNRAKVAGGECCGGICGYAFASTISFSRSTGEVSGSLCGGILGEANDSSTVKYCTACGAVRGISIGGIAGSAQDSALLSNQAYGEVIATEELAIAGGIVGFCYEAAIEENNAYQSAVSAGGPSSAAGRIAANPQGGSLSGNRAYSWMKITGSGLSSGYVVATGEDTKNGADLPGEPPPCPSRRSECPEGFTKDEVLQICVEDSVYEKSLQEDVYGDGERPKKTLKKPTP